MHPIFLTEIKMIGNETATLFFTRIWPICAISKSNWPVDLQKL